MNTSSYTNKEKIGKITYFADDQTMGETSKEDCQSYRNWAKSELENFYPEFDVEVVNEYYSNYCYVEFYEENENNYNIEYAIELYCKNLWDKCSWNF